MNEMTSKLDMFSPFNQDKCTLCGKCFHECPVLQLPLEESKKLGSLHSHNQALMLRRSPIQPSMSGNITPKMVTAIKIWPYELTYIISASAILVTIFLVQPHCNVMGQFVEKVDKETRSYGIM